MCSAWACFSWIRSFGVAASVSPIRRPAASTTEQTAVTRWFGRTGDALRVCGADSSARLTGARDPKPSLNGLCKAFAARGIEHVQPRRVECEAELLTRAHDRRLRHLGGEQGTPVGREQNR